ncbi:MAG: hypothetical protein ACMUIG_09655 [Thermoplasmatota archaeon]
MIDEDPTLSEKLKSDLLYLEQLNSYCQNTVNTPEYIRAMAMYTQALHVLDTRYKGIENRIYIRK